MTYVVQDFQLTTRLIISRCRRWRDRDRWDKMSQLDSHNNHNIIHKHHYNNLLKRHFTLHLLALFLRAILALKCRLLDQIPHFFSPYLCSRVLKLLVHICSIPSSQVPNFSSFPSFNLFPVPSRPGPSTAAAAPNYPPNRSQGLPLQSQQQPHVPNSQPRSTGQGVSYSPTMPPLHLWAWAGDYPKKTWGTKSRNTCGLWSRCPPSFGRARRRSFHFQRYPKSRDVNRERN